MNEAFVVIMAGGSGTRFWPKGRRAVPKQLLSVEEGKTLIQATIARIPDSIPRERILVVTNVDQADALAAQIDLPDGNILREPVGRNTAACIGLAATVIERRASDSVIAVMPADHVISPPAAFQDAARKAVALVEEDSQRLVLFGVPPTFPSIR